MYDEIIKTEERLNNARFNDTRLNRGFEYDNSYSNYQTQEYINNYLPTNNYQNDVYTTPASDNINMNVNEYPMYSVNQQANMFAQAPIYQQQYYEYQNSYNNISAQAQTHPTNYYQQAPQQVYHNIFRTQPISTLQQEEEYETIQPPKAKQKKKNKMLIMLISVYIVIVAFCAALVLVNVIAGSSAATVDAVSSQVAPQESNVQYLKNESGELIPIEKTEPVVNYAYETNTNWFDKMCDKIGAKLG